MDIRITHRSEEETGVIARNWGRRINEALRQQFTAPMGLDWFEEPAPKDGKPRTSLVQYFDLSRKGRLVGRVHVTWAAAEPGSLKITAGARGLAHTDSWAGKFIRYLAWVAAFAAFALWVWFAWADWGRIWNRVSSFQPGYDATHATKLEVAWLLLGWAVGPAFAGVALALLGEWVDDRFHQFRSAKLEKFARRQLDGFLTGAVQQALAECARNATVTVNLGQAHPGSPHPAYPHTVYSDSGQCQPAPGYVWASTDPNQYAVKPAAP